jgi:hypothetical protein
VEFIEKGDDLIYHFWPPSGQTFCPDFHRHLEAGFHKTLPANAEVEADYTDIEEARVMFTQGLAPQPKRVMDGEGVEAPRETYFVKVIGGMRYPLANRFLKAKVFDAIEAQIIGND